MFKFLIKVAILIIGLFILSQLSYVQEKYAEFRGSVNEKMENVGEEVTRVQGKVGEAKERVDKTRQQIENITTTVKETADKVEDAFIQVNKAVGTVNSMLSGESGETVSEPSKPPAEEEESGEGGGEGEGEESAGEEE